MLLLGIDVGTSSIKVSVVNAATRLCVASAQYPEAESPIISAQPGWAEQSPEMWWQHVQQAILKANATKQYDPKDIGAIGIAYQMHGLVVVDEHQLALRHSIIWCDSRSVEIGDEAFDAIGHERSLEHLLNSPGNFTASKLAWVKRNEPELYAKIRNFMLPGDFIAMKLTGEITTTVSALSEGIFWDFKEQSLSGDVFDHYGFSRELVPSVQPVFSNHGQLKAAVAASLSLRPGIPVSYKAGDQPNNALSLNVLEPGEVAANAGTSGVIYGVSDQLVADKESRVNSFAHVNYSDERKRVGVLLCINGTGILNRWAKNIFSPSIDYTAMNEMAGRVKAGAEGLRILPFGNGAERMLGNRTVGVHFQHIDLNIHSQPHIFRAVQEGIACAFRYGLDIMRSNGMDPKIIRIGKANLFLSKLFTEAFVNTTGVPVEFYPCDGSVGAAMGAGIGVGAYTSPKDAFACTNVLQVVEPGDTRVYEDIYGEWKLLLEKQIELR